MAKIVRFHQTGGPEVLKLEEVNIEPPKAGEVQIKVKALGLNRAEAMFRSGQYFMDPIFPSKLGYEAAGIVDLVGPGVLEFKKGDVVSIVPAYDQGRFGVYGEVATVPQEFVVKHPTFLSFEEAAAVWMQYMTAYGALVDIAKMTKEDYVVIPAASSSVGLAAIQLCHLVGATPIALTRTTSKKKALMEAGATHVVVTDSEDIPARLMEITKGKGARIVFDPVGGKTVLKLVQGMSREGIIFIYGKLSPDHTPFPQFEALSKGLSMRGYTLFEIVSNPTRFKNGKDFILEGLESKKLKPIIAKTFKLDQIVDAHSYLESNQQFGKIIVTV